MPYFENDGVSLYYEVHGSGRPVVMLHGGAVSFAANFGGCGWVEPFTARGFQMIGLDARGHGNSDKPHDTAMYGTDAFARDVIELMEHLGIERSALVGYSIGSTIALHLLHTHPQRFNSGALVATGDGLIGYPPRTFPEILPMMVEAVSRDEYPADLPPQAAAYWTFATNFSGDRAAVAAGARADYPPCSIEEAGSIDVPVLVVSADGDTVLGTAARLADALPRGKYLEIAGADHFSLALDETVKEAVADFLDGSS